tara:strand:- start:138 stop:257 length:120 start_codon:yes stop_codon:yes gene_type:complete
MKNNIEKDIATDRQLFVDDYWITMGYIKYWPILVPEKSP